MTILELTNVKVNYGQTTILRNISLTVNDGAIVSLIGRNGVGKSTLMKTIIGLLAVETGTIQFRNQNVTALSAHERANLGIGYIPQGREVFPRMTVAENLRMGERVNAGRSDLFYEEVYDYFPRLEERKNQKAGTLSGGEQQMLAIGRALVGGPDLLILDEPSEGIQPSIVTQISKIMRKINDDFEMAMFFVEQNIDFTAETADHCYVMEKGEVVEELPNTALEDSDIVQRYLGV